VYKNTAAPMEARVSDLVGRMTLEEKVGQMQNHAAAIPRLGVPAYEWWSEGLHGLARLGYATLFPQAVGLAATWDTTLMGQVAETISTEGRSRCTTGWICGRRTSISFAIRDGAGGRRPMGKTPI
jgi:beta-glucosidase